MAVPAPQQVAPQVYLVTIGRGAAASNVYLVRSGSTWTLVDAAWAGSAEAIRAAAAALFGPGARPVAILLTHVHPDHSGAAGALARFQGVPVYVHADELPMAAGRYLPQYLMPLDRWVIVPIMRLFPPRIRARIEAATSITDVAQPLPPEKGTGAGGLGVGPHARAHPGPRRLPAPPRRGPARRGRRPDRGPELGRWGVLTPDDLDDMAALLGDPQVMRYYPQPKSREEALAWIAWNQRLYREHGFGLWLLTLGATGRFVGDCDLTPQQVDGVTEVEVGYHVRAALQGRGLATEAAAACRDYARDVLGVGRLIAIIGKRNRPSQRVAEKLGLVLERESDNQGAGPDPIASMPSH